MTVGGSGLHVNKSIVTVCMHGQLVLSWCLHAFVSNKKVADFAHCICTEISRSTV